MKQTHPLPHRKGKIEELERKIQKLKDRNKIVEADKAWETSLPRKVLITILTYLVIALFFLFAQLPKPFINAIVPSLGYVLSTLSDPFIKKLWMKYTGKE